MKKRPLGEVLASRMNKLAGLSTPNQRRVVTEGTEEYLKDKMSSKLDKNFRKHAAFGKGRAGQDVELTHLDKDTLEDEGEFDPHFADFEDENLGDVTWSDDEDLSDVTPEQSSFARGSTDQGSDEYAFGYEAENVDDSGPSFDDLEGGEFEETPLEDLDDEIDPADEWMASQRSEHLASANKFKFESKKSRMLKITESQLRSLVKKLVSK